MHVPCMAILKLAIHTKGTPRTIIKYSGNHRHRHPHEKVSEKARERLSLVVNLNEEAKLNQNLRGTSRREKAREIYPALNNLDTPTYEMGKVKAKIATGSIMVCYGLSFRLSKYRYIKLSDHASMTSIALTLVLLL